MDTRRKRLTWQFLGTGTYSTDHRWKVTKVEPTPDPMYPEWELFESDDRGKTWKKRASFDSEREAKRHAEEVSAR